MRLNQKLILGFTAVALLVGIVGYLGLYANNRIVSTFEGGEKHFGTIIEASNEVSSFAKRAQGHLMLYITLHNGGDRQKFFQRLEGLRNQTAIIDRSAKNPLARAVLANISAKTDDLQLIGESLLGTYDRETKAGGEFEPQLYEKDIRKLDDVAAGIRRDGLNLAKVELGLQAEQQNAAKKDAEFLHNIILALSALAFVGALVLGITISRSIAGPISGLKDAAAQITRGNFSMAKVEIKSDDETGELSEAFNKMTDDLRNSSNEIEKREAALKESKRQLEDKVVELEKINRLAVGRELRMAELKKELAEQKRIAESRKRKMP